MLQSLISSSSSPIASIQRSLFSTQSHSFSKRSSMVSPVPAQKSQPRQKCEVCYLCLRLSNFARNKKQRFLFRSDKVKEKIRKVLNQITEQNKQHPDELLRAEDVKFIVDFYTKKDENIKFKATGQIFGLEVQRDAKGSLLLPELGSSLSTKRRSKMHRTTSYGDFFGYKPLKDRLKDLKIEFKFEEGLNTERVGGVKQTLTQASHQDNFLKKNRDSMQSYIEKVRERKRVAEEIRVQQEASAYSSLEVSKRDAKAEVSLSQGQAGRQEKILNLKRLYEKQMKQLRKEMLLDQ